MTALPHRRMAGLAIAALLLCGVVQCARADEPARDVPPPTRIRDLDYGNVLFYFFQDDYFESIVRLEANRDFRRLEHHSAEADLLSGGLYLSLGMHAEATRVFDRLLAGAVPVSVSDRARFYLARIGYQRGYDEEALRHLDRIARPLPGKLEPERQLLTANVLMALGRYADAAQRLGAWTDASGWSVYARFNLGVAYVRAGDLARGRPFLEQVGAMTPRDEEQASLRDRANLALGFALLQAKGGTDAAVRPESRAARWSVHEPGAAGARLGRVERRPSRSRIGAVARTAGSQADGCRRAGVAARRSVCLREARLERPGLAALPHGGRCLCRRNTPTRCVHRRDSRGRLPRRDSAGRPAGCKTRLALAVGDAARRAAHAVSLSPDGFA